MVYGTPEWLLSLILTCKQTVWTQIRLLHWEQSDIKLDHTVPKKQQQTKMPNYKRSW